MFKKWITWANYGIGGLVALLFLGSAYIYFTSSDDIIISDPALTKRAHPTCSFAMSKSACDSINKTFELKYAPMTIQLPDLRTQLLYTGKNGRPDASVERAVLHFSFIGNSTPTAMISGDRLYLVYDAKKPAPGQSQYSFSPNNAETPLWIEATSNGNEVTVQLRLKNENGDILRDPAAHAQFNLTEKEIPRANKPWEIGKLRVDGSLLARQKARWMGPDVFLEKHGGEEFKDQLGKHRIDFTDEAESYSVYVGVNDALAWINNRWKEVAPGPDSRDYPLLIVKKIDDRLINFDLWDVGGKNKLALNLLKSNEQWAPQGLKDNFKFMGARTRSQYIFEVNKERMFLSPHDWVLQTKEGWIKLTTPEQIDDYVNRKLSGVLVVFEDVENRDDGQFLMGIMYNPARTETQPLELAVQPSKGRNNEAGKANGKAGAKKTADDEDDDSDDEDEDDEEIMPPTKVPGPPKFPAEQPNGKRTEVNAPGAPARKL